MAEQTTRYCPRPHHRGRWRNGSPPLDRFTDGSGWACPGLAPDGSACGYQAGVLAGAAGSTRERLGRLVRETWVAWALGQPDPKPSWLAGWDELDDGQREVDMRIGEAVAAAERARIYAELGNGHYVIFTEDRWTVEHSVECKLSGHMHECAYHEAIALIADEYDPDRLGRWRITGISEGLPDLERAEREVPGD